MAPVKDRSAMIAGMDPVRRPGLWHFANVEPTAAARLLPLALASIREDEGLSLLLHEDVAQAEGLTSDLPMAQISLSVHSALDGVGLTAAVSAVLADAGIPCNVIAGACHDHIFVPEAQADQAVTLLKARAEAEQ